MTTCLKIWGHWQIWRVRTFLCVIMTFYLSAHASILKVFEECPISKFGTCFTIGRLVVDAFCYIFCFMGIMQCYFACSLSPILQRIRNKSVYSLIS